MAKWVAENWETLILLIAASAVIAPALLGMAVGHLPRDFFFRVAVPLTAVTILLALGILWFERHGTPSQRLVASLIFGFLWIGAGLHTTRIRMDQTDELQMLTNKRVRLLAGLFIPFGLLWILISVVQYVRSL